MEHQTTGTAPRLLELAGGRSLSAEGGWLLNRASLGHRYPIVCDKREYPRAPRDAAWGGRAFLVWADAEDNVVALDCSLASLSTGGLETLQTRVDIGDDSAHGLRAFLIANDVPVGTF